MTRMLTTMTEILPLRWVETDTISNTACWIEFPTAVNKNVICISGAHGKSTCNVSTADVLPVHKNHFFVPTRETLVAPSTCTSTPAA